MNWFKKNANHIAFGTGLGAMICGAASGILTTVDVVREYDNLPDDEKPVNKRDTIRRFGKKYIFPGLAFFGGTGVVIGSYRCQVKTAVAAGVLAEVSSKALGEYKDGVKSYLIKNAKGNEDKAKKELDEIDSRVAQKHVDAMEYVPDISIRPGEDIVVDTAFGQVFSGSVSKLQEIENRINYKMRNENFVPINEFYILADVEPIGIGWYIGWDIKDGYLEFKISSVIKDGRPIITVDFSDGLRTANGIGIWM